MQDSATILMRFQTTAPLDLEAAFDGGRITSDGGLVWLADADRELGLCEAIAGVVSEWRSSCSIGHDLTRLVRQRVYQVTRGYEDQNDANTLRSDPLLKLALGRLPETNPDWPASPPSRVWRMPRVRGSACASPAPWWSSTCVSAARTGRPRTSSWTATPPLIRPTASRKARATTATTGRTCTIPCWSSTVRPSSSSPRS